MISTRSFLGFLIALAIPIVFSPACRGEDEPKITVKVVAVLATSKNKEVDEKLKCLATEVQKKEPTLTGFQLKTCSCTKLSVGEKFKFPLVDDEVAEVSIQKGPGKNDWIGLTIKPPLMGKIVYDSCCEKFFPIMTRYQTKNGERLIIAVCVHCCCDKDKNPNKK
jgi:hypothetical protein